MGTVNYMSPEALSESSSGGNEKKGRLKIGRASDVWSLGCILYEMVYGQPPFARFPTLLLRLKSIMDPSYAIEYPRGRIHSLYLQDLLRRCLDRQPKRRISLEALLDHSFIRPPDDAVFVSRERLEMLLRRIAGELPKEPQVLGRIDFGKAADRLFDQLQTEAFNADSKP